MKPAAPIAAFVIAGLALVGAVTLAALGVLGEASASRITVAVLVVVLVLAGRLSLERARATERPPPIAPVLDAHERQTLKPHPREPSQKLRLPDSDLRTIGIAYGASELAALIGEVLS